MPFKLYSWVKSFGLVFAALIFVHALGFVRAHAEPITLVGFGDSLMAGYQLPQEDGFPAQLEAALKAKGHDVKIMDAGVSGDTTSGGLARLDWSIPDGVDGVILELGANDALRGIPPELTRENMFAMVQRLKERGIRVFIAGMLAPPNMGDEYGNEFNAIYPDLAAAENVPLYPFFMEGVMQEVPDTTLIQGDGLHPTKKGVAVIVERILPQIELWLEDIKNG